MNVVERVANFMLENQLTLVTAESCTAGLISATLADVPGADSLLECAFVTYSVEAKRRCLGAPQSILSTHNLTSEAVARAMALGAARNSSANVAVANTGVTDDTDDRIPAGSQCYAWVFKQGQADASPTVYPATKRFSGGRNCIRQANAEFALAGIVESFLLCRSSGRL
ncbi:CinA family protein [Achromobacter kerstersii]|uniref:Nicotinamide-nucleotide amidohydrolase PncC n=1 Tax=Achromobacter kerstersii TaxID=1353890 RepID=A0A6S7AQG3_9BURK|nr:nicotinamide-nucleotide amidohydrolase family protein [Achromobacter kerstersii]CAB3743570.1 Nicotinamide-nucleotide amidohydrolase PncC [Achromobacter kerstersii]